MKKLLLISAFCFPLSAFCTDVLFPLNSMFGGGGYAGTFQIQSQAPLLTDNTNIYVGTFTNVTATAGTNPVVSLAPNNYLITFAGARTPWRIAVTNASTVLNALQLTTGSLPTFNYTPPAGGLSFVTTSNSASVTFTGNGTPTNPISAIVSGAAPYYYGQVNGDNLNLAPSLDNGTWQYCVVNGGSQQFGTFVLNPPSGSVIEGQVFHFCVQWASPAHYLLNFSGVQIPDSCQMNFPFALQGADGNGYRQWIITLRYSANVWVLENVIGSAQEGTD